MNFKTPNKKILTLIIAILLVMVFAGVAFSKDRATLYISPKSCSYKEGETFKAKVIINTEGNKINSARGLIEFSNNNLEVLDIDRDKSIFTFWDPTTSFSNDEGEIFFGGGLPSPGFSGSSGEIMEITFKAKDSGSAILDFKEGGVLLNDKKGTDILGRISGAEYKIKKEKIPLSQRKPKEEVLQPPQFTSYPEKLSSTETFYIEGESDPNSIVILYIEKQDQEPIIQEADVNSDGAWSYVHEKFLQPGKYSIYAKAKNGEGEISAPSEVLKIKIAKGGVVLFGVFIRNEMIYGIIILFLLFAVFSLFGYFIYDIKNRMKTKLGLTKEVKEANDSVVDGFGLLKEEIRRELKNLHAIGIDESATDLEKENRKKFVNDLAEDIELIDRIQNRVRKEIKDIEDVFPT